MVDNAAALPGRRNRDPDPRHKRRRHRRPPPPVPHSGAFNPPQIDVQGAASPVEEAAQDVAEGAAIFSTGAGGVESYHYDRRPMQNEQRAANELAQNPAGPGQP